VNVGLDLDADVVEHWRNRQPSAGVIVGADAPAVTAGAPMVATIGGNGGAGPSLLPMKACNGSGNDDYRRRSASLPLPAVTGSDADSTWSFLRMSALDWLRLNGADLGPDDFVYADPPYLHDSRSSGRDFYNYELTYEDHEHLIALLLRLRCKVMVSHYHHSMYMNGLKGWRWDACRTVDRAGNEKTEYIWCNYDQPTRLHDYRWLGADFRQRQNIKRKQARWVANLAKMDRLERLAMMEVLEQEFGG
jgi:hypothetical protein